MGADTTGSGSCCKGMERIDQRARDLTLKTLSRNSRRHKPGIDLNFEIKTQRYEF